MRFIGAHVVTVGSGATKYIIGAIAIIPCTHYSTFLEDFL